jgi:hypothetical protein
MSTSYPADDALQYNFYSVFCDYRLYITSKINAFFLEVLSCDYRAGFLLCGCGLKPYFSVFHVWWAHLYWAFSLKFYDLQYVGNIYAIRSLLTCSLYVMSLMMFFLEVQIGKNIMYILDYDACFVRMCNVVVL